MKDHGFTRAGTLTNALFSATAIAPANAIPKVSAMLTIPIENSRREGATCCDSRKNALTYLGRRVWARDTAL